MNSDVDPHFFHLLPVLVILLLLVLHLNNLKMTAIVNGLY